MNEQATEQPSATRRMTDAALVIIALAAIGAWLWRRVRLPQSSNGVSTVTEEKQALDDKIGGAVGFPPNNAPV